MLASELDFPLPPEAIAQTPASPRDSSKLLRLECARLASTPASIEDAISHHRARDLAGLLRPDDLLVFNDTRVLRARLHGKKPSGGRVEVLLLKEHARNEWEAMLKPSARLREGGEILFENATIENQIVARLEKRLGESWRIKFLIESDVRAYLSQRGEVPLPPYIKAPASEEQYQTVYSHSRAGMENPLDSAAAPTAGLHFTPELLEALQKRGVSTCFLTLGVGVGTFRPIQTATLEGHTMHEEEFEVSTETAQKISAQKRRGARVIAVGTTTTRVLESLADEAGNITAGYGKTSIFIRPGFAFRCVDALLTNFHLPRSTLLALVAAFVENRVWANGGPEQWELTGLEIVRYAYAVALAEKYRFFSFGDAMLIE
jgi:S-adenosylmethionine:tRNA ribosyltransferase-isomerase